VLKLSVIFSDFGFFPVVIHKQLTLAVEGISSGKMKIGIFEVENQTSAYCTNVRNKVECDPSYPL